MQFITSVYTQKRLFVVIDRNKLVLPSFFLRMGTWLRCSFILIGLKLSFDILIFVIQWTANFPSIEEWNNGTEIDQRTLHSK